MTQRIVLSVFFKSDAATAAPVAKTCEIESSCATPCLRKSSAGLQTMIHMNSTNVNPNVKYTFVMVFCPITPKMNGKTNVLNATNAPYPIR